MNDMNYKDLFTPKTLAEFWASAPSDKSEPERFTWGEWSKSPHGPNVGSYVDQWRWPQQDKVIDLSCLAGSGVLCKSEFGYAFIDEGQTPNCIFYPALGVWQACNGNLPELPEGLDVTVRAIPLPELSVVPERLSLSSTGNNPDLWHYTAYRVDGKLDGYKWPWE